MKYIKILWLVVVVILLPVKLSAQDVANISISGIVINSDGNPVIGATVAVVKEDISTTTDKEGAFYLDVASGSTLAISATGFAVKFVGSDSDLSTIKLDVDVQNEPVNVAYRSVNNDNLMGGISNVNVSELLEKNYYTYSLEGMQGLVGGYNNSVWGMDGFLVMVDGVPRDPGSVMPTEIDQISFLKGASAVALYGSRGAKGVILITTKRGTINENKIRVRTNTGLQVPISYPQYLGSAEYMSLYNEARVNDGLSELYTQEDIYHHASGENPYRYPDVNYYSSDYLQKVVSRSDATLQIEGGNDKAKYYTNIGYISQGSLLNFGEAKNNMDQRVNVRGNVDMRLNRYVTAKVDAAVIFNSSKGVNTNYWNSASTIRPNRYAPLIPISMLEESDLVSQTLAKNSKNVIDGKYLLGGTQLNQTNPIGDVYAGGKSTYNSRQFQFNAGVNADLNELLEGLSFSSLFGADYATTYVLSYNPEYATYGAAWNNYSGKDMISSLTKYNQDAANGKQNSRNNSLQQTLSFSGQLNYAKKMNQDHSISAMLVAAGYQQAISGVYHRVGNLNLGVNVGYNYKNKYFADFSGAMVHSAKLPEANRDAFSQTYSLGWKLSNEDFLDGVSAINNLKLYASAGVLYTDLDINGYYLYDVNYNQTNGAWYTWRDGLQNQSTDSRRGENPDLRFPKRQEVSLGVDAALFDNLIEFNGSVFLNRMSDLANYNRDLYPSYFESLGYPSSSFIPYVNYNSDDRIGFDYNLRINKNVGDVKMSLGLTGTYYTTKANKRAEVYEDAYQYRAGKPIDAIWGLQSNGFFMDQADIDNSPEQAFGEVKPGDIKYLDQNNDGVINNQDEVYLGKGGWFGSPLTMGVNFTAQWKSFTLFAMGVARTGAYGMKNSNYFWVNGEDKYSTVVRDRWTEATKNTATYPRLTTLNGDNNFRSSDFWIYSTNRFDLTKVQVSYDFPMTREEKSFIQEFGVYVMGANLLTIAPNRDILQMNVSSSPQTRFFNIGVKALF
jgi:TonB-linked SusC/RagA family outer membrane protein